MAKKRKHEPVTHKQEKSSVEVIVEDLNSHPICLHGPTLLFSSEKGRYFACASCRNKDCPVHIDEIDWAKEGFKKRNEKYYSLIPKLNKDRAWKHFNEVKSQHSSNRAYCATCDELYIVSQSKKHLKDHRVITPLSDEQLAHPASWIPPLENDSVEAQYLFTKKSTNTILGILRNNNIKNVLCIGTPTIHETVQSGSEFNSLLLDCDSRYHQFNDPKKYLWYNMFNNYLFDGNNDDKILKEFFKKSRDGGICIVMDPPFGGRVEPLVHTIRELSATYNRICDTGNQMIPVIWAFPYFSEPYIKNMTDEIKMHDYQVEYENHKKFQNNKGRKFGSPVRFFTNLHFSTIDLSNDSKYKRCEKCKFWVSANNNHCNKCQECTSKNGMTYRHCNTCKRCVKPTFTHCETCKRCSLEKGHVCGVIIENQSCYNCSEKGHKKSQCPKLKACENRKKNKKA